MPTTMKLDLFTCKSSLSQKLTKINLLLRLEIKDKYLFHGINARARKYCMMVEKYRKTWYFATILKDKNDIYIV